MHVTKEGIDRLKAANPLEIILADRGIELRKKGRVLVARCPFHEEKTASFTVTPVSCPQCPQVAPGAFRA